MNRMRQAIADAAVTKAQITADSGEQEFCFAEEFLGFAGHFPGYPILPGILQTLLGQLLAEQVHGGSLEFVCLERAKFNMELRPQQRIKVVLSLATKENLLEGRVKLYCDEQPASSFVMQFKALG